MALVTFQLIEGLERGRVFADLSTPVTIGREEENSIQLNDERVSRFHAKIQDDEGRIILTDLESTNGTRVNGHPVQLRVLQPGDQISLGRCLLIYGSREQIEEHYNTRGGTNPLTRIADAAGKTLAGSSDYNLTLGAGAAAEAAGESVPYDPDVPLDLFPHGPPSPPDNLRPAQRALVSDFAAYLHEQIRWILQAALEEADSAGNRVMRVDVAEWQRLLKLEMELAVYMRQLAEPDEVA